MYVRKNTKSSRLKADLAHPVVDSDAHILENYFGCKADDRMNLVAFDENLHNFGVKLKAMLGSDIGYWDVLDMTQVLEEAHKPVQNRLMNEDDFCDFSFTNPVMLHAGMNPAFFMDTSVETSVGMLLKSI